MKVGRNDPCPCGSGKKYKKCCLKTQEQTVENFAWYRLRSAIDDLHIQLIKFAPVHFGEEAIHEAWAEFTDWESEEFDPETLHIPVFMPWFFYDWLPDEEDTLVRPEALDGQTLAQAFLNKKNKQLQPLARSYLEQCCLAPFSFYDILSVRPGHGYLLRDVFTEEEIDVSEHRGSITAEAGCIIFGKVVQVADLAVLEATSPLLIPSREKKAILDLRHELQSGNALPITSEILKDNIIVLLEVYHDIMARLINPAMPVLQNTDGEPLVCQELHYQITSPQVAFDALKHLSIINSEEELLTEAKVNSKGELRAVEIPWQKKGNAMHQSWDNTILGHIRINGRKMTVEVNSDNRAKKISDLVEQLLPNDATYKTTVFNNLPNIVDAGMENGGGSGALGAGLDKELQNNPEIQRQINEMMRLQYLQWPNEALPALNGKTPLQAIKTKDGREMVEALLLDFERSGKHHSPPVDPTIFAELRERLGLQKT